MSWENRDYNRSESYGMGGGAGWRSHFDASLGSVTLALIGINVLVFLVDRILEGSLRGNPLSPSQTWGHFSGSTLARGQVWRLVTYQFLHMGFLHLLFNMIGLYVFGHLMERWWSGRRFLVFYLVCGVAGALLFAAVSLMPAIAGTWPATPLVGASAAVLGCIGGSVVRFPRQPMGLMFLPFTFTIGLLGGVWIGLDVLQVVAGGGGAGSAVAHLGGAAAGALLAWRAGLLGWADRLDTTRLREGWAERRREREALREAEEEAEVDRILDKVREHGLHSLSEREKRALRRETDRKRRGG